MLFQREKKKELWRYASKNCTPSKNVAQNMPLILRTEVFSHSCKNLENSFLMKPQSFPCTTLPCYYSSIEFLHPSSTACCYYFTSLKSGEFNGRNINQKNLLSSAELLGTDMFESVDLFNTTPLTSNPYGKNLNKYHMLVSASLNSKVFTEPDQGFTKFGQIYNNKQSGLSTLPIPLVSSSFATAAANILRYCCFCGIITEKSDDPAFSFLTNERMKDTLTLENCSASERRTDTITKADQDFKLIMKQLKRNQISLLLQAVKSRKVWHVNSDIISRKYLDCILIKRQTVLDEEPYLKVCRLFFWSDLQTIREIKRLPNCPTENDSIYVCCNPLHWYRIVEADIAPPPYVLEDEYEKLIGKIYPNIFCLNEVMDFIDSNNTTTVESQTTDGEGQHFWKSGWCEVAYWELTQRVGSRCYIKSTAFNISIEKIPNGNDSENICIKNFVKENQTIPQAIKTVRQRIGLGVTVKREIDGVWLYNRSLVPIFLHSPTLHESWERALKLMPGDCVKAFNYYCNDDENSQLQYNVVSHGPVDMQTIRLSFAKGWGCNYKRQDITRCPCWLEIFFKQINHCNTH